QRALLPFLSDFDANGLLRMYPTWLLAPEQWARLLGQRTFESHLDVGAGSGDITVTLAGIAQRTLATERSRAMARRLRERGIPCEQVDVAEGPVPAAPHDLVTCLNVIDRCPRPLTLLTRLAGALAPGGRLVVATPLPFDPFYYDGPRTLPPLERLDVPGETFEEAARALAERVFRPLGLEVETLTRAPYLCQGDARTPLYVLDDAIFFLTRPGVAASAGPESGPGG
ncbi:MAG: methyltransferase domain-containing protein, partial [Deltaproteobacteria bacterium]|nr:methyltransferase domain-containing protein [Deltaproteobacteria bacterium]